MRAPEIRRLLFDKLRGLIDPVELLQGRETARLARMPGNAALSCAGESAAEIASSSSICRALRGKFVVVFDGFAQQAGKKTQRKPAQHIQMRQRSLSRFGRIRGEMFGLEIARLHYNNSRIGLPAGLGGRETHDGAQARHQVNGLHGTGRRPRPGAPPRPAPSSTWCGWRRRRCDDAGIHCRRRRNRSRARNRAG